MLLTSKMHANYVAYIPKAEQDKTKQVTVQEVAAVQQYYTVVGRLCVGYNDY